MRVLTDEQRLEVAIRIMDERDHDLYVEACLIAEQNDDIGVDEAVDIVIGNL